MTRMCDFCKEIKDKYDPFGMANQLVRIKAKEESMYMIVGCYCCDVASNMEVPCIRYCPYCGREL